MQSSFAMLLPLLLQFLSTANFVVSQTPATVQPGQCMTMYKCADGSGRVRIPGGKGGGGDHVEEKCLEAESIVNPDGSWGGSNCTKPLIEWVDEDPKDPNTVWACSCPPGAQKQRLPLRPGNRSPAASCPTTSCPTQVTGAETNYKNLCPKAHGRRETINGIQYEYSCESTLSPLSEELSITGIHHPRACASFCSDNPACEGFVWRSDLALCYFDGNASSRPVSGGAGSLVLKPTSPRGATASAYCPQKHKQRQIVDGHEYEISCDHGLQTTSGQHEPDAKTDAECARKCSLNPKCEGITWDHVKNACDLRLEDPNPMVVRSETAHALKKVNSPWKQKADDDASKNAEEDRKRKEAEDRKKKEDEDRKKQEDEDRKRKEDEDRKRQEDEDRKKREDEDRKRREDEDRKRQEDEDRKKKEDEYRKKKEEEERQNASMDKWRSASWKTMCGYGSGGPDYLSAYDSEDNPRRVLITIGGEIYILYCNTATLHTKPRHSIAPSPWACAEECSRDSNCMGVGWINSCVYHSYGNTDGHFKAANGHHALYKKSLNGKINKCVKQRVPTANSGLFPC